MNELILLRSRHDHFNLYKMDIEYKTLSTDELLDILTKSTMRYNHILLEGGPTDEFDLLREAIKTLQREVEKRREEEM